MVFAMLLAHCSGLIVRNLLRNSPSHSEQDLHSVNLELYLPHFVVSAEPREDGEGHFLAMILDFANAIAARTLV